MAAGWIKLHRALLDKPIWQCSSPEQKAILITMLMLASHEEKQWIWNGKKYHIQSGQFVASLSNLARKSGTSVKNVRTSLKNFSDVYDFLKCEMSNQSTLITISNWNIYQGSDDQEDDDLINCEQKHRHATGTQTGTRPAHETASEMAREQASGNTVMPDVSGFSHTQTGTQTGKQESKNRHTDDAKTGNYQEIRSKEKRSKENKNNIVPEIDISFIDDQELKTVFLEFIEHRRQIKKPMTQLAIKKAYQQLIDMSASIDDQIKIINNSISNGWQGLFPLKDQNSKQKQSEVERIMGL